MNYSRKKLAAFSAVGAACSLAVWLGTTNAEESSVLINKPGVETQTGPALPPPQNPKAADDGANGVVAAPQESAPTARSQELLPTPPQTVQQPPATTAKKPFMRPAVPRDGGKGKLVSGQEPTLAPDAAIPLQRPGAELPILESSPPFASDLQVRPTPPIKYDTDHDARKMYRTGEVNVVMLTKDPADGCAYEIPMCIPACCVGDPSVSGGRGLLGRGVVEYRWPCGFRAIVKFRHLRGDIEVEYEGD